MSVRVNDVEKEEADKLKKLCEEHWGENACFHCNSPVAQWTCVNHPSFKRNKDDLGGE